MEIAIEIICGKGVSGLKTFNHPQVPMISFEHRQGWRVGTGQLKPRYGSNIPSMMKFPMVKECNTGLRK